MIELIYGGHGEGKTMEVVRRAASWIRTGGSVLFLAPTRYSASHVEQVADLVEHEVPEVRERFTAASVAQVSDIKARLSGVATDNLLVVIDGASELVVSSVDELRRAGVKVGIAEVLALTFDLARSVEAKGYRVVATVTGD